jgi:hypothetical protein
MTKLYHMSKEELAKRPSVWRRPGYRAMQRAQRSVFGKLFVDRAGDQRGTTWVLGGSRSGTTWIAEALNHRNDYRYMWEPLTPPRVPYFAHFVKGQYLRPATSDPQYAEPLAALLTGRMRHPWIDHLNCNPAASRRLVKDIFGNLLARWVHENLPGARMVFLIRHPLAVVASRMDSTPVKVHGNFRPDLDAFLGQELLMNDFLAPFESRLRDARTPLEQYALRWCVENFVPLSQFGHDEVHVVHYERLRWHADDELPRLARYLGRDLDGMYAKLPRPSRTAGFGGSLERGVDPATAWTARWSREEVRQTMSIIAGFGLDQLYTDRPDPNPGGVEAYMREQCASRQPA